MNSKRDIFWQDKIYLQVADGESRYNYQSYPVQGSHAFKDGEDVTGRYELERRGTTSKFFDKTFAIPTPAPVADNPDHIFNPVAELPKEATLKAKELVEKFFRADSGDIDCHITWSAAKQCALICCDEILNCKHGWNKETSSFVAYWQQVRTAINKI